MNLPYYVETDNFNIDTANNTLTCDLKIHTLPLKVEILKRVIDLNIHSLDDARKAEINSKLDSLLSFIFETPGAVFSTEAICQ